MGLSAFQQAVRMGGGEACCVSVSVSVSIGGTENGRRRFLCKQAFLPRTLSRGVDSEHARGERVQGNVR